MKLIKKRGVWLMVWGFVIILCTIYPALALKNGAALIVDIAGWAMVVAGAVILGKQKKQQRMLEQAMYRWAETGSPVAPLSLAEQRNAMQSYQIPAQVSLPEPPALSAKQEKTLGTIMLCVGIVPLFGSLPVAVHFDLMWVFFIGTILGFVLIVSGIIRLVRAAKMKKAAPEPNYVQPSAPVPQPSGWSAPQQTNVKPQSKPASGHYQFCVAGLRYRMDAIRAIAKRNPRFEMNCDDDLDKRQYEFLPELPDPVLVPEPENPHDPNAIGVHAGGWMIGYVPADETKYVRPLISQPYRAHATLAGGKWRTDYEEDESNLYVLVDLYY